LSNGSVRPVRVVIEWEAIGAEKMSIFECLESVGTPEGHARLKAFLESEPFPHFEGFPGDRKLLIRIDADRTRTVGKFVDRKFVEVHPNSTELSRAETPE
jgi:hypothetical protein